MKWLCMGECGLATHSIGALIECAHCGGKMSLVESSSDVPSTLASMQEQYIQNEAELGLRQLQEYLRGDR